MTSQSSHGKMRADCLMTRRRERTRAQRPILTLQHPEVLYKQHLVRRLQIFTSIQRVTR